MNSRCQNSRMSVSAVVNFICRHVCIRDACDLLVTPQQVTTTCPDQVVQCVNQRVRLSGTRTRLNKKARVRGDALMYSPLSLVGAARLAGLCSTSGIIFTRSGWGRNWACEIIGHDGGRSGRRRARQAERQAESQGRRSGRRESQAGGAAGGEPGRRSGRRSGRWNWS